MADNFDRILDDCIDRINRGDSLEACLSGYPEYAERLRPLISSMAAVQESCNIIPSPDAKRLARQKFYSALDKRRERPSFFRRLLSRPATWAAVAVAVVAVISVLSIRPAFISPSELVSSPEGNFAFLISDEVNAIGDFESLNVTISRIGLRTSGGLGKWFEFTPEVKTVDLTQLQGDKSQEIWRGSVPTGSYSQAFIYVDESKGKLKATGQIIDIKLPGNKLHMSKSFDIIPDMVTSFTYDLTVVSAGQKGKYILKPQISESGAQNQQKPVQQNPSESKAKGKK